MKESDMFSLKESLKKLESFGEFKKYKKENPKSCLTSFFIMLNEGNKGKWQMDFYNPETHKIVTFVIAEDITKKPADEIFQKEKGKLEKLDLEKVKIDFKKMLEIAENSLDKECKPTKKIIVLQTIEKKETWNVSFIAANFQLINMRIDAQTGEITSKNTESLLNFRK